MVGTPRYVAVTFDSQTVLSNSFEFDGGLLAQLKQFKGSPITVAVSDVVLREIEKHLTQKTTEVLGRIRLAHRDGQRFGLMVGEAVAAENTDPAEVAKKRLKKFLDDIGAVVVPSKDVSINVLLRRYFEQRPPFSTQKPKEFPDAIALMALHLWAQNLPGRLLAVSGDRDWAAFANMTEGIGHVETLAEALQEFQPDLTVIARHAERLFRDMAINPDSGTGLKFTEALSDEISTQRFEVRAESEDFDVEVENAEVSLKRFSLIGARPNGLRVLGEREGYLAVQLRLYLTLDVRADLEVFASSVPLADASVVTETHLTSNFLVEFFGNVAAGQINSISIDAVERPLILNLGNIDSYVDYDDTDYLPH